MGLVTHWVLPCSLPAAGTVGWCFLRASGSRPDSDPGLSRRAAAKISDGSQYYVLLIITDGVISDMIQTKEAIVSVSPRRRPAGKGGCQHQGRAGGFVLLKTCEEGWGCSSVV